MTDDLIADAIPWSAPEAILRLAKALGVELPPAPHPSRVVDWKVRARRIIGQRLEDEREAEAVRAIRASFDQSGSS